MFPQYRALSNHLPYLSAQLACILSEAGIIPLLSIVFLIVPVLNE